MKRYIVIISVPGESQRSDNACTAEELKQICVEIFGGTQPATLRELVETNYLKLINGEAVPHGNGAMIQAEEQ